MTKISKSLTGFCKTTIVDCKNEEFDIYIGRPSKWGNPFTHIHLRTTLARFKVNSRKEALEKYEKWLTEGEGQHLLNDLDELRGKRLGCWCKPLACHGDILVRLINNKQYETKR